MKLRLETDGDRYPKDVYLCEGDERIATMEGHNETTMRHKAIEICRAVNSHAEIEQALSGLIAFHDDQIFICGKDDEKRVAVRIAKARAVLDALKKPTP